MRPKLLRDFGWKVTFVLAKDWYEDSPQCSNVWIVSWLALTNRRRMARKEKKKRKTWQMRWAMTSKMRSSN